MPTLFQRIFRRLSELLDVSISAPSDKQVLTYDSATSTWKNEDAGAAVDVAGKADKVVPAAAGNVATLDAFGNLADGGATMASKAPLSHTHAISDTTGLQTALDAKAAISHTHDDRYFTESEITTTLASYLTSVTAAATYSVLGHNHSGVYSPVGHTHAIADTAGLQAALDAKALSSDLANYVTTASLAGFSLNPQVSSLWSGSYLRGNALRLTNLTDPGEYAIITHDGSAIDFGGLALTNVVVPTSTLFGDIPQSQVADLTFLSDDFYNHLSDTGNPHGVSAAQVLPSQATHGGKYLQTNGTTVSWQTVAGGSASPGGSDTQVQFNDGGAFAGDSGLVFNKTTNVLTAGAFAGSGASLTSIPQSAVTSLTTDLADKLPRLSAGVGGGMIIVTNTAEDGGVEINAGAWTIDDFAMSNHSHLLLEEATSSAGGDSLVLRDATGGAQFTDLNVTGSITNAALTTALAAKALASDLTTHTSNTSNPHAVTKAQVGLTNVTNDAQLKIASNLSDLNNASTARTNLGLGTAATSNTGDFAAASHTSTASGVHGVTGNVVGTSDSQTLTNKTISGASNTLSNIAQSSVTSLTSDLAAKAPLASPTFTGTVTAATISATGNITTTGAIAGGSTSIAFAASITPNCNYLVNDIGTLTANITTIANPSGTPVNGQQLTLVFTQNGTGGFTTAFTGTQYAFGTDVTQTNLNAYTTANKIHKVLLQYHSTSGKWQVMSVSGGF